jgi:hypothetical protein
MAGGSICLWIDQWQCPHVDSFSPPYGGFFVAQSHSSGTAPIFVIPDLIGNPGLDTRLRGYPEMVECQIVRIELPTGSRISLLHQLVQSIGFVSDIYFFARTPIPTNRIGYTSPLDIGPLIYTAEVIFWCDLVLILWGDFCRAEPV